MTSNFTFSELACKCCGKLQIDNRFLETLDFARVLAGYPFIINSGYRCDKHNKEVGSTSNNHTSGKAVDIGCETSNARFKIITNLLQAGFVRIGIAKNFIHVDKMDEQGLPKSIWLYE